VRKLGFAPLPTFIAFLPAALWFAFASVLFTLPGSRLPAEDWLQAVHADKWVHIALFAGLAWLLLRPFYLPGGQRAKASWVWVPLFCLGYGVGVEFLQETFIPIRSFDVWDIAADAAGTAAGTALAGEESRRMRKRAQSSKPRLFNSRK
jgi:hypothetical protein